MELAAAHVSAFTRDEGGAGGLQSKIRKTVILPGERERSRACPQLSVRQVSRKKRQRKEEGRSVRGISRERWDRCPPTTGAKPVSVEATGA